MRVDCSLGFRVSGLRVPHDCFACESLHFACLLSFSASTEPMKETAAVLFLDKGAIEIAGRLSQPKTNFSRVMRDILKSHSVVLLMRLCEVLG